MAFPADSMAVPNDTASPTTALPAEEGRGGVPRALRQLYHIILLVCSMMQSCMRHMYIVQ